ncbi:hypothetical protein C2E23DRAFT_725457 [Lenzites betulinus]|nr:hypothetical protein C2E23DRAFT_725457 [Lenzites betulinus]
MNSGDGNGARQYPPAELVQYVPTVVTPEDYRANLERVEQMRAYLAAYEASNQAGLQRYYNERQALEADIERGRVAYQRLTQLNGQPTVNVYPPPVAGPSNVTLPQSAPASRFQAPPPVYNEVEAPTSARIVEVQSPQVCSYCHQLDRPRSVQGSSGSSGSYYRPHVYPEGNTYPQQHGTAGGGGISNFQPAGPRRFPTNYTPAGTNTAQYQSSYWNQRATNLPHNGNAIPVQQQFSTQHAQSSNAFQAAPASQQSALPPVSVVHAQPTQVPEASNQPRYGSNTASALHGALGTSSGSTPQSVPHSKVTYSSRTNQGAAEAPQSSYPPPGVARASLEHQLAEYMKTLSIETIKQLFAQVMLTIERKQKGAPRSTIEEEIDKRLDARARQASEILSEKFKKNTTAEIQTYFSRAISILASNRQPIQLSISENTVPVEVAASTQSTASAQPMTSTPAYQPDSASFLPPPIPPQPTSAASSATSTLSKPTVPSLAPLPSSSAMAAAPSTPSASTARANTTQSSAPHPGSPEQIPPLSWYLPKDPNAPMAYRDGDGHIRYMFPNQANRPVSHMSTVSSSSATAAKAPAMGSFALQNPSPFVEQTQTQEMPTAEMPGTPEPVDIQPPSPWSPEKADRSRLARDILRSLGRPHDSLSSPPVTVEADSAPANPKRKSPPFTPPRPSTPFKKPRVDVPEVAEEVEAFIIPSADVIDLTASTSEEDVTTEPMRTTPEPDPESTEVVAPPRRDHPENFGEEEEAAVLPPVEREASAISSEAADDDKVQEMFSELPVADSVASGPPSSVKSSSPPQEMPDMVDLPSIDARLFAMDTPRAENALPSPSPPPQRDLAPERASSPSRGASNRTPLFLPSPSSSPGASSSALAASPVAPHDDEDSQSSSSPAPRPLYGQRNKGKGKARASTADFELASSAASEARSASPLSTRPSAVFVEVPPLPKYARQLKEPSPASSGGSGGEASEDESGTYGCRWQSCTTKFTEEAKLAEHLRRHGRMPLYCPYDGCDKTFNTTEALLAHQRSNRHRNGTLRASTTPFSPAEGVRAPSPLPDVLPAYMSVSRRVARHPISKERHQWLGPKVLENITAFKYSGGRSNAAQPPRSRRLAEKVAAVELAGVSPEAALAQIQRWMDDEYLAFADGYDAARRPGLRCADIPSQEVTQRVRDGIVFWPGEDDLAEAEAADARAQPSGSQDAGRPDADMEEDPPDREPEAGPDASMAGGDGGGAADDSEESGVDQLAEDVGSDGQDGSGRPRPEAMATTVSTRFGATGDAGGKGDAPPEAPPTVPLPRSVNGGAPSSPGPARRSVVATLEEDKTPPSRDRGGGGRGAVQVKVEEAHGPIVQPLPPQLQHPPWPIWPPPPPAGRGDEEAMSHPPPSSFPPHFSARSHAMQALPSPGYISARSAEVILSDVRPIKLKPEALQSINVLLDEFLYSILSAARSIATDKLKAALLKVLPTSLGKEALLEAEVELKAYWERTTTAKSPASPRGAESGHFDLQWSFELLRLKCEAYSTMNDSDEDAEAEKRLQQRMEAAGSSSPPNPSHLAPAALYLTAILEAICEHVLSNVSRVAARDSARTLATIQDLFTALGEDDALYGTLKSMKAYEQIESLSKAQRPRRSKSFSRSTDKAIPRTSTSSPTPSRARLSTDSSAPTVVESRRTSMEKAKAAKIFHSRSLSDRERHEPAVAALARSHSEIGISREVSAAEFEASPRVSLVPCSLLTTISQEDEELQQEFDELMRSGATMKVSLTPDRLKSMEVYKQERSERERGSRRAAAHAQEAEKVSSGGGGGGGAAAGDSKRGPSGRPTLRHVDSIIEDDEDTGSSNHGSSAPAFQSNAASVSAARMRNTSFTAASSSPAMRAADQRLRSISISNVPHPRHEDGISRKTGSKPSPTTRTGLQNTLPSASPAGIPKRTRKMGRNRESMDLDDIMNASDNDESVAEAPDDSSMNYRPPTTPRRETHPISARQPPISPRQPHVSKAAQDLIAFLEAGPPDEPTYNPSMNASVISFESSKTRSGRLQRMMSRLTLGGSKESLNGSIPEEPRGLSRKNSSKVSAKSTPPPSFKGSSIASKRSITDISKNPYPNVIVATPPPRPVLQTAAAVLAEPSSTSSSLHNSREDASSQTSSLNRRSTRKAVPTFEDSGAAPGSPTAHDDVRSPVSLNGHRSISRDTDGASPTSPAVRKPAPLSGHPVKIDTSESSLHPYSITSPPSAVGRKSPQGHSKAESGYASRSASRSPVTPSEPLPPSAPPAPTIPGKDVDDLRRLMGSATSAAECRLLVDMFLAKNGLAPQDAPEAPAEVSLADALAAATLGTDEIERGLVALFLGGGMREVDSGVHLQVGASPGDTDESGSESEQPELVPAGASVALGGRPSYRARGGDAP